jgi:hypothetical protein
MFWDQLARSLKQFIARASTPPIAATEAYPQDLESIAANDDWDEAAEMTPYAPDTRGERYESSQHLSC